jgi:hypothetical protein
MTVAPTGYLKSHPATKQKVQLLMVEQSAQKAFSFCSFDGLDKLLNAMSTHSINKNLLLLRERIVGNLYEKIKTNKETVEELKEILFAASTIIEKARNEQELIAVFDIIATQLEVVSNDCELFGNTKLAYIQRNIANVLHECIKTYLPHNISNYDLIKILWPHNCWDIISLRNASLNYIFENAVMMGVDEIFIDEFISNYKVKIKRSRKLRDLVRVYEKIKEEARVIGLECYEKGNHEVAYKYGILSRIIGFLLSDFEHCSAVPTGTFKFFGYSSIYL